MKEHRQEYQNGDQRYIPRWEVKNKVLYKTERDELYRECSSKNISCSGACISTEKNVSLEKDVTLVIYLSENVAVHVKGQVVWHKEADNEYQFGLRFDKIDPQTQDIILEYAFNLNPKSLSRHWFNGW